MPTTAAAITLGWVDRRLGADRTALRRLEREINDEVLARFPAGTVEQVTLLTHDDTERVEPGELLVRVLVPVTGGPPPAEHQLQEWATEHHDLMRRLRRELSLRLPPAKQLEFTAGQAADAASIVLADDPELTAEPLPPREIVQAALRHLCARYVFPELAEQAATVVRAELAAGAYDDLDEEALAELLTSQLQEICHDKHLRVRTHEPRERLRPPPGRGHADRPHQKPGQLDNFGIQKVERLDGNIGYLDLRRVPVPEHGGQAIAAAMELVSGTSALIIDLRQNHGGSPDGVVFWCSYLFPGPTHLNDIYTAGTGETRQFWSLAYLPGERYLDRPVYLLCSGETFSGGEDFCYTLQAQGRAEVIGEPTGGGAHPTDFVPISATIGIGVPFARSINPVTGSNWQGTGVRPDTEVPAERAYDVAYGKALRQVLADDPPPPIAREATAALGRLADLEAGAAEAGAAEAGAAEAGAAEAGAAEVTGE